MLDCAVGGSSILPFQSDLVFPDEVHNVVLSGAMIQPAAISTLLLTMFVYCKGMDRGKNGCGGSNLHTLALPFKSLAIPTTRSACCSMPQHTSRMGQNRRCLLLDHLLQTAAYLIVFHTQGYGTEFMPITSS